MFLANLKDRQKTAFLDLAQNLVASDGVLSAGETEMVEQYKQEMGLPRDFSVPQQPTAQSIGEFQAADVTVQKQILFELVALAYADDEYAEDEKRFLHELCTGFGISADFLDNCQRYVKELTILYAKIEGLIGI